MSFIPISDYGIIGNMLSAALVGSDGSIDWCCLPRFDSPSIFAAILDDDKGGRFHIKPQMPFRSLQSYLTNTNVLQATFETETGIAKVVDFMPCYRTSRGRLVQFREIHRQVDCSNGEVALEVVFEPRLNYARDDTLLSISKYGITAKGGAETLALSSSIPFTIDGDRAIGRFTLQQGQRRLRASIFHSNSLTLCKVIWPILSYWLCRGNISSGCFSDNPLLRLERVGFIVTLQPGPCES